MNSRLASLIGLIVVALAGIGGCASYSDNLREAHTAVAGSHPERAVQLLNKNMDAPNSNKLPPSFDDGNVLLLLERATVLQSLGDYELAARDMMTVDDHLEYLDLTNAGDVELAKYMYSGSSEAYAAPAYERLLLNTLNMVNFMAMNDLQGAKVEARRFALMEQFFLDHDEPALLSGILSLGNYLAGAAFEHSRDYQEAARYYGRAYFYGIKSPKFRQRLIDITYLSGYKPRELQAEQGDDALADIMEAVSTHQPLSFDDYHQTYLDGDTIVVVQTGLAPWKKAERVPISEALGYTSDARYHTFNADQQTQVETMVANGVLASVNFPMLTTQGLPSDKSITVSIDGVSRAVGADIDVASQVETAYAHLLPGLMVAAITRLITRIAAGQVTKSAVDAGEGDENSGLGILAGLAVQGAMMAADTPDTRSWMTLPGQIRLVRIQLDESDHSVSVSIGDAVDQRTLSTEGHSLNIVNFSRLR